jgi:cell division protein FtsB
VSTQAAGGRTLSHEGPRLTGRAAALLVTVMLLALLALVPAREFLDQRSKITVLEQQAEHLAKQNVRLEAQVERLHDPVELERLARECLGMVAPGETALILPDGNPDRTDC